MNNLKLDELKNVISNIVSSNVVSNEQNKIEQEEAVKKLESQFLHYNNVEIEKVCWSKELYEIIKKNNWNIISYEKLPNIPEYACDDTIEKYHCEYNGWEFTINNMYDCDIEEGIFGVYSASKNEDVIEYYFDAGCRNTGGERMSRFIRIINSSNFEEYFDFQYNIYFSLINNLEQNCYDVELLTTDKKEIVKRSHIVIRVDNVYLVLYESIFDELKFVITNDKKWDVNSSNSTIKNLKNKRAYFVKYDGIEDYANLLYAIETFKEEVSGKLGVSYKNIYFSDSNIYALFSKLKEMVDHEAWNHYHIKFEYKDIWGMRGYGNDDRIANMLTGPIIHSEMVVTFNDAAQWSNGNTAFVLTFVAHAGLGDKNIKLNVYGYQYDNSTRTFEFKDENAEAEYEDSDDYELRDWEYAKLDFENEIICNPDELKSSVYLYVKELCNMFDIKNTIN